MSFLHKVGKSLVTIVFYPLAYLFWLGTSTPREREEKQQTLWQALVELWR